MHKDIAGTLERADELYQELMQEYERSLLDKNVSDRAVQLTHEVCERLRSILDRSARRYWDLHVAPSLSEADREAASIYFPIAPDRRGFDSMLGRWRWKAVRQDHLPVCDYLLATQPFSSETNHWLTVLHDLAVKGKHIHLVPQKRIQTWSSTLEMGPGGGVVFGPGGGAVNFTSQGVTFSG